MLSIRLPLRCIRYPSSKLSSASASPRCWAKRASKSGTSIRFTGDGDTPQPRLILHGPGGPIDLGRLHFTADRAPEGPVSRVMLRADLPVDGVRLEESFAPSRDGYDTAVTVRLVEIGRAHV